MPEVIQVQKVQSVKSTSVPYPQHHKQLLTLKETGTLVDFDGIESIESLKILPNTTGNVNDNVNEEELNFLESKISLLELLLEAKNAKLTEQATELAKLRMNAHNIKRNESESTSDDDEDEDDDEARLLIIQKLEESRNLQESRRIAASFIHAESLYLDKLDQLECQLAIERMEHGQSKQPYRLFPIAGSAPAHKLEETLLNIQKILMMEPNVSTPGLILTEQCLEKTLKESNEIIELQHSKIQQVLDSSLSSSSSNFGSLVLVKELLGLIYSCKSFPRDEQKKICNISVDLLSEIQNDSRILESTSNRLEDQLALNLEIKKLLISAQIDKQSSGLIVHLNDVLKENADLKQQLHLYSARK